MDTSRPRTIKIGTFQVGLMGLDAALERVMKNGGLSESEAGEELLTAMQKQNYVPDSSLDLYREALQTEYRRRLSGLAGGTEKGISARILGQGCISCHRLYTLVIDTVSRFNIVADVEEVHDLDEIWRFGIMALPALLINGKVRSSGRLPTPSEVEQWLCEAQA